MAAHIDGNISHKFETLPLFKSCQGCHSGYIKQYMYFPLDLFVLRHTFGIDLIHCTLVDVLHLSDNTRDTTNWSRVHGP